MGKVYLVGAGPGDPDLLTRKAYRVLKTADVVLYDRLVSKEILALVNPLAEMIYLGKHEGHQDEIQQQIHRLFLVHGWQRKTVVRLKGGDPMVFGRGAEEWRFLREQGIETEIVPGISSAIAVPSVAGIPLTFRGLAKSFAVITGHDQDGPTEEWHKFLGVDTLVILMGVKNRALIAQALIAAGRPAEEPVAFVERGTTPEQRVVVSSLSVVAAGEVSVESPAVFVVGSVVNLREQLVAAVDDANLLATCEAA